MLWLLASALFALYVANFSSYNKTYGCLGGVIVFLDLAVDHEHHRAARRRAELRDGAQPRDPRRSPAGEEPYLPLRDEPKDDD